MAFTVCQTFGRKFAEEPDKMSGTRVYNVTSTTDITDLNDVLDAAALPDIGDAWDSVLTALVAVQRTPMEVQKELGYYQVVVDYETDETLADWKVDVRTVRKTFAPQRTLAPFSNAPTDPFSAGRYLSPAGNTGAAGADDLVGYPLLNRASDPFEQPPKIDFYQQRIILSKTVSQLSDLGDSTITGMESIVNYLGCMNSDTVQIAGLTGLAWTFLVDDISFERIYRADGTYNTKITLQILFDNTNTHASAVLNAGYRETYTQQDGNTGIRNIPDKTGKVTRKPALLDTEGKAIRDFDFPKGSTGISDPGGPPYYICFPLRQEIEFAPLELPETWV